MTEEHVPEEQTAKDPNEASHTEEAPMSVSRRDFLIGGAAGLVAGAAGVAGVGALRRAPATETAQRAPVGAPAAPAAAPAAQPQAPATTQTVSTTPSDLPATHRRVKLNIDGRDYEVVTDVRMSLWEVMTYEFGMAASNIGCDRAQCGACAVVVDGLAVNACTVLAARLGRGQKILTVNSLSKGTRQEDLHPIAKAYLQEGGFQCGICTRGFIMATYALLERNPSPNEAEIREALSGNICRCSEYPKIYESVFRAAEEMRKKKA